MNAALADPAMQVKLAELGGTPIPGTPEDFGKTHRRRNGKMEQGASRPPAPRRNNRNREIIRQPVKWRHDSKEPNIARRSCAAIAGSALNDLRSFGHRSRLRQFGYDRADWAGKPVIGIINTWSDINACHGHLRDRAEDVKRGVFQAGGFPIELPAMSLAEPFVKPSTMLYRNFLAMETEELLRSHPIDGAVLMGGCDKTTPGLRDGRDQHGHSGDLCAGRADAARQLARRDAGLGLRRLEILGRKARRPHRRQGVGRDRGRHFALASAPAW